MYVKCTLGFNLGVISQFLHPTSNFEIFRSVLTKNCIEQNTTDLTFTWDIVKNQNFLVLIYEVPQNIFFKNM